MANKIFERTKFYWFTYLCPNFNLFYFLDEIFCQKNKNLFNSKKYQTVRNTFKVLKIFFLDNIHSKYYSKNFNKYYKDQ